MTPEQAAIQSEQQPQSGAAGGTSRPGADGAEPLVQVRGLVKHFPITRGIIFQRRIAAVQAVDDVSFDVQRGETLGIVGESGCGKSTTARLVVRLLDATAGEVRFEGRDITHLKGPALKAIRPGPGTTLASCPSFTSATRIASRKTSSIAHGPTVSMNL